MTNLINIPSQLGQPAVVGGKSVASADKIGSSEFGSLLATLFGLTAPAQTPNTTTTTQSSTGNFDLSAFGFNLQLQTGDGAAGTNPTAGSPIEEMLGQLTKALEGLLNGGGQSADAVLTDSPKLVTDISDAIEALSQLLNGAANSAATDGQAANLVQAGTVAPQNMIPAAQAKKIDAAMTKLAELSAQLGGQNPELASKLDALTQKLNDVAPRQASTPTVTPVDSEAAELAATISSLLGGKQTGAKTGGAQTASSELDVNIAMNAQESDLDLAKTLTETARIGTTSERPEATTKPVSPNATATSAVTLAAAASTSADVNADTLLNIQSATTASQNQTTAVPKLMTAAYQSPTVNLNVPHIAFEMASQFKQGASRFEIRLDPPEMGKIDVRMDVDKAGNLNARLTVERPDTLDLLQRDARALERALSQAGLDGAKTNLEFSLKQNPFANQDGHPGQGFGDGDPQFADLDESETIAEDVPPNYIYRGYASPGGVNMLA